MQYINDAEILDLYAGTGNLGIEALSRGAKFCTFIDKNKECSLIIKENLKSTKLNDSASILTGDIAIELRKLANQKNKFDIIFMDPPYNKDLVNEILDIIIKYDLLRENGIIIVEHSDKDTIKQNEEKLTLIKNRKYGHTILSFFKFCKSMVVY